MGNKNRIVSILAGLGFLIVLTINSTLAQNNREMEMPVSAVETSQFQKLEQPLNLKLAVIAVGLGLISAELWWFLFSKGKNSKS
jgi:plastocyanin domain-containing protein